MPEMLGNREWVEKAISHQETERVPYCFDFTPPARRKAEAHYGSPIEEVLDFPIRMMGLKTIKPLYADPTEYGALARDEYGVGWRTSTRDRGVPVQPCLTGPDLSGYAFPDFSRAYRFEDLGDWCTANSDHYRIVWVGDLWERATFMRGIEKILMDVALAPGFVERLLRGIADYVLGGMEILSDRFEFEAVAVSDDYGSQKDLLMSPSDWRRFIRPLLEEIYGSARKHGRSVLHHSDGNICSIVGDLVEMGSDVLHPVQPEAMDVFRLKREFGDDLTLMGAMRTQDLLPSGTPEEIRNEVRRLKDRLGAGGGYIAGNGITIQEDVPLENMAAMIGEAVAR